MRTRGVQLDAAVVAAVVGSVLVFGGCAAGSSGAGLTDQLTAAPTAQASVATTSRIPTPSPVVAPELLAPREGLPPLYALPADVWGRTGPGWVLGVYRPERAEGADAQVPVASVLVLASPEGTTYFVRNLASDVDVAYWKGGSTTALTTDGRTMDLRTGDVSGAPIPNLVGSFPGSNPFVGMDASGRPLWFAKNSRLLAGMPATPVAEGAYPLLSPDGRYVVLSPQDNGFNQTFLVFDTVTSTTSTVSYAVSGERCGNVAWSSASSFTALCVRSDVARWSDAPDGGAPKLYKVDAASGAVSLLGPLDVKGVVPSVSVPGAMLPDGTRASVGTSTWLDVDACPSGVYRWIGTKATPLVDDSTGYGNLFTLRVAAGFTWVGQNNGCSGNVMPQVLWAIGATGVPRLVFPYPDGTAGSAETYRQGLTSWAPAA